MSWTDHLTGAGVGGGLVGLITVVARLVGKDRSEERKAALQSAKVEAAREATGAHATERAYDRIERLLGEEREERRREREELRSEIDALREENAELRSLLAEAQLLTAELRAEVDRLRNEMVRAYVKSEPPAVIGRVKKG